MTISLARKFTHFSMKDIYFFISQIWMVKFLRKTIVLEIFLPNLYDSDNFWNNKTMLYIWQKLSLDYHHIKLNDVQFHDNLLLILKWENLFLGNAEITKSQNQINEVTHITSIYIYHIVFISMICQPIAHDIMNIYVSSSVSWSRLRELGPSQRLHIVYIE